MTSLAAIALLLVPYPRPSVYSLAVGSTIGVLAEILIPRHMFVEAAHKRTSQFSDNLDYAKLVQN